MGRGLVNPGDRVRLNSGREVGAVDRLLHDGTDRILVRWDSGRFEAFAPSVLVPVAVEPGAAPPLVGQSRLDYLEEEVLDSICSLVRAACGLDSSMYRGYVERIAQRLGDV